MEVQGQPEVIDRLIACLNQGRFIQIESMDAKDIPVVEESGFRELY